MLRQVDAPLIGTVLNGASGEGAYGYTYAYYRPDFQPVTGNGVPNGHVGAKNGKKASRRRKAHRT